MSTKIKILVVDDEPDVLEIIDYNLNLNGYEVYTADNGEDALLMALKFEPDLIILDIMMPKLDGVETCKRLRANPKFSQTLIVFLTARSEEFSEIAGFEAGADDYISKPIKPKALMSRINAILRRNPKDEGGKPNLTVGDLVVNRERYVVVKNGIEISLPRKEFELLYLLVSKPGKVFTRDSILENIWGSDVIVVNRTIDVHVRKIREKVGDDCIVTIKGIGYKFERC